MILSNRKHLLGFAHFGVVQGATFGCAVSTASQGFRKGYSSAFIAFDGEWSNPRSKRVVAMALLNTELSKKQRAGVHATFLAHLDKLDANGVDLKSALDELLAEAKEGGIILASHRSTDIDVRHIEALMRESRELTETYQDDLRRLQALMKESHQRIGEAAVTFTHDGKVFVHPDLAAELEKPENQMLSEILADMAKHAVRTQNG
jgi:hypothetical protein